MTCVFVWALLLGPAIRTAGTFKRERVITSPQLAEITVQGSQVRLREGAAWPEMACQMVLRCR